MPDALARQQAPDAAPGGAASGRWAIFLVVAVVLAGVVPVMLVVQVSDTGRSTAWSLTIALAVWAGIRMAHRIALGIPALFDFVFWLFVYIFMGIAPTAQIRADQLSTTTPGMDPARDVRTATVVWAGVICYELGRWIARHTALLGRRASGRAVVERRLDVVPARAVVLTAVGVLAAAYYVSKIGVGTLFMSRYSSFAIRSERLPDLATRSIISAAGSYPLLIASGVYLSVWRTKALGALSGRYLPLLVPSLALLLLVTNPVSSARYDFGTVAFALVVFVGAVATVRRARVTMALTIGAFLFVFPLADAFRSDTVQLQRNGFFGEYLANPDYDAFWQIGNALSYVDEGLVQPMRQLAGVVLFWVPRGIWPTKPVDTGILLADYRGYTFGNLSAPLWAELLVNGGILLVIAGFVLLGVALGRLDRRTSHAFLNGGQLWAVVGGVFPFYMVILLRGSLLQATGTLVVAIACTVFVRRSTRTHDEQPPSDEPQARGAPTASRTDAR
ncbi:hypothetical protein [Cellulomonas sp. PhB150]|uniref:hypothetical protein n=1 Tax=Cellulomonas sp. PhB150 TaxID=2485188 RepID=UPI000F4AB0BF|nr:hypothetical protein [Cellulomonas sp. PhB150]ROS22978.1 hypothetical protein EDF34_3153 [Cellulomonas sp. PhB150]